jgi:YD repeat-containing protein
MLYAKSTPKFAMFAAAAGLATGGLLAATVPAQAAPGGCEQFAFPGFTTLRATGQGNSADFNFTSNEPTLNGAFTSPQAPGQSGNVSGAIDANGHVELNFADTAATASDARFSGDVGPDEKVHGAISGVEGDFSVPAETLGALKCMTEVPKEGPTVEYSPILGGLNVHVTDRSGTTSQCTYDSDGFTRTFRLEANKATDLKIVPAIPKFANWNVKITCDNGSVTETTQFF